MQENKPTSLIDLSLVCLVFFVAAFGLMLMAVLAGFYRGISFLPWIVLCWGIGMLAPIGNLMRQRFRWLGWCLLGAIIMYVGIYMSSMRAPSPSSHSDTTQLLAP